MLADVLLWLFALCGAAIAWAAINAANCMSTSVTAGPTDPIGWSMTGVIGLWAAMQPLTSEPIQVSTPLLFMALSLAVQSWRLSRRYEDEADAAADGRQPD